LKQLQEKHGLINSRCLDSIPLFYERVIYGEMSSYQTQPNYYRYHPVMPSVPRESLSMQDLAGGDNNRTPVKFQGSDIYRFVGEIAGFERVLLNI